MAMDQPQLFLNAKWFINSMFEEGQFEFDAKETHCGQNLRLLVRNIQLCPLLLCWLICISQLTQKIATPKKTEKQGLPQFKSNKDQLNHLVCP